MNEYDEMNQHKTNVTPGIEDREEKDGADGMTTKSLTYGFNVLNKKIPHSQFPIHYILLLTNT